jgi:hypothetical protein
MDASAALAAGEIGIDGDRATVTPADGRTVVTLQKVEDGTWKVDIGALIKGDDVTRSIPLLQAVTKGAAEIRAKLDSGEYKNAGEVKNALQARILELVRASGQSASTLPTSLPVGG